MNNDILFVIEIILVITIIVLQIYYFFKLRRQIKYLEEIFPVKENYSITKYYIPVNVLSGNKPSQIFHDISDFEDPDSDSNKSEVDLISVGEIGSENYVMKDIKEAINTYLLRNKGAVTDFNLVKEIVERYAGSEEENTSQSVNLPLFLGLMGTIIGIIFGLGSLYFATRGNSTDNLLQGAIPSFLTAVSIAMVASFCGLLFTVINSNFNLKRANTVLESDKNAFYTFIQIELLPILNQNISSSVYDLHKNLTEFNQGFKLNLSHLDTLLKGNADTIKSQEKILETIENIDPVEFAKANVKVLQGLKGSMDELKTFTLYLNMLGDSTEKLNSLSSNFKQILEGTNYFKSLAEKLDQRIESSNKIIDAMNSQLKGILQYSDAIKDVVRKVDEPIQMAIEELRSHTENSIGNINKIVYTHDDAIRESLSQLREYFSNQIRDVKNILDQELSELKSTFESNRTFLDNLEYLKSLDSHVTAIKSAGDSQRNNIQSSLDETQKLLEAIKDKKLISFKFIRKKKKSEDSSNKNRVSQQPLEKKPDTQEVVGNEA